MNVVAATKERIGGLLTESVSDNPVIIREFRTRMRGWKAFAIMAGYVLFLGLVLFITYSQLAYRYHGGYPGVYGSMMADSGVGMKLFQALNWTQTVLLAMIIPALTFGSITHELERKTIEMLALSRLTAGKIVLGKQLSGFLYALMLLVCSAPLSAMCLMFGGVSPAEIAITYGLLVIWAFMFSAVGVFWSSLFSKTATAALFAYGSCGVYMLVTYVVGQVIMFTSSMHGGDMFIYALLNPGWVPFGAMVTAKVCSMSIPLALASAIVMAATAWLLLLVASTHVRHQSVERALPIRLVLLGLTAIGGLMLVGNTSHMGVVGNPRHMNDFISINAGIIMAVMCLGASMFATGCITKRPDQSVAEYALSIKNIFRSNLAGGILFMMLWTLVAYGVLGLGLFWTTKSTGSAILREVVLNYAELAAATLAVVLGVSTLGVLGSTISKQRRAAAALVVVLTIGIFAGYGMLLAYYQEGISNPNNPLWQLAAFWPLTPLITMSDGWHEFPKLLWSEDVSWIVTSCVYMTIAVLFLGMASSAVKRHGGVQEE